MLEHLPALQVVVPLMAAPLIVLVRSRRFAWLAATAASWACLAIAIQLALRVADGGAISYALGSWPPPWGIEYRVDALSAFVLVLVSLVAAVVAPYAWRSLSAEVAPDRLYLLYAMYCLCLAGLLGITITGDAFNLFVFLEISSLSSYVMIALGRDRRALLASYQYLILGTIGATFYVIGVGMLYLMTGTLNIADLATRVPDIASTRPVLAGLAFITIGVSLKLALFPLHLWLPNAYAFAPSAVTALLAATATKVAVYVLLRFHFTVFGPGLVLETPMPQILLVLSIAAIVTASLVALWQADLKRLFAYSSVAQVGYITLGISMASAEGLTAAIVHLFNHGITKGALFLLVGGIAWRAAGRVGFDRLRGLAQAMPLTSLGIVISGLSLIGIPGTAGFISKWYLVLGAMQAGRWWLAALIVGTSLIAVAYVWRFVEAAYLSEPAEQAPSRGEAPAVMLACAWLLVAACVWFGFDTSFTVARAREAAALLLGGAP